MKGLCLNVTKNNGSIVLSYDQNVKTGIYNLTKSINKNKPTSQ